MRRRARIAVAAAAALALTLVLTLTRSREEGRAAVLPFAPTRRAAAPFGSFAEARVGIGDACVGVLVAATGSQRVQGLRGVRSLGPYAGMLFVYPDDTTARFTMASTPLPLDIVFYDAAGVPVDRSRMVPCPEGGDADCPTYASRRRYRYALETPAGAYGAPGAPGPGGPLGGCA
jgi:hypothetical protein